jgi:hypothetical protein
MLLLPRQASVWAVRGSSEARFSPCKKLIVSSTHLESGTALTDVGLLLGKMAIGSVTPRTSLLLTSRYR